MKKNLLYFVFLLLLILSNKIYSQQFCATVPGTNNSVLNTQLSLNGNDGNFLYSGENYTYTNNNTDYILEVTSNSTGFKDYDMIEVSNNTSYLTNIYPNPATNTVNIEYGTLNCTNAYIMLVNLNNSSTANYILNLTNTNIDINLSGYNSGLYRVVLFCDNQVIESKNLIIN